MDQSNLKGVWKLAPLAAALLLVASAAPTFAAPPEERAEAGTTDLGLLALIGNDDVFAEADLATLLPISPTGGKTQHYGPYEGSSPDSGTCGPDWAQDEYQRHFTVRQTGLGSYEVIEQFKRGTFQTIDSASPGACEPNDGKGKLITAGFMGTMHGYFVIEVTGSQTGYGPDCQPAGECTTAGFIESHFTGAVYTIGTFFFHYAGYDGSNQGLIEHEWTNASPDRGGNRGDISSGP